MKLKKEPGKLVTSAIYTLFQTSESIKINPLKSALHFFTEETKRGKIVQAVYSVSQQVTELASCYQQEK
jgi:hypothetical protein